MRRRAALQAVEVLRQPSAGVVLPLRTSSLSRYLRRDEDESPMSYSRSMESDQ